MKNFDKILISILFLDCIVLPFDYYELKLPILLYFVIKIFVKILITGRIEVSKSLLILFGIYVFSGLFFVIYGIYTGFAYDGSFKYVFALYVVFPVIWAIFIAGIPKNPDFFPFIEKILNAGIILTSFVMISAYLNKKYGYFGSLQFIYDRMIVDLSGNVIKIRYHGISSLLFLFPFFFTKFILDKKKKTVKKFILQILILGLSVAAVSLSGRRALLVLFFLSVFNAFVLKIIFDNSIKNKFNKNILFLLIAFLFMSVPVMVKVNFTKLFDTAKSVSAYAFNLDNNKSSKESDNERIKQIKQFVIQIQERPVIGYGYGAPLQNVIRSEDKPWRYEMSYFDIIFHTGFLGFLIYSIGPLWILFLLLVFAGRERRYTVSILALFNAFLSILIAFATNPYLNAFDIQWVIYLPIFYIEVLNKTAKNIVRE